jgi:hypothetical protein
VKTTANLLLSQVVNGGGNTSSTVVPFGMVIR